MKILVTGAGGFIGGHLVGALLEQGHLVKAADIKPMDQWWQVHPDSLPRPGLDLREAFSCAMAVQDMDQVYNLATDMGGIGYLTSHRLDPMLSVLINTHLLQAAAEAGVERYLFTSSACVYGEGTDTREQNAYPAHCEDGYGWEKLFSERMCRHFQEEGGLVTRVARLHNVYGPHGSWNDGREKAPAAICRKVAEVVKQGGGEIEIWGNGDQTRSFMHISDCVEGLQRIMGGLWPHPVNLGSEEMVTIDRLLWHVEQVAGVRDFIPRAYKQEAPRGVQGRNSDNTMMRGRYGWEPSVPLSEGLKDTYAWVAEQVNALDPVPGSGDGDPIPVTLPAGTRVKRRQ